MDHSNGKDTSYPSSPLLYEVYEEECVETLSDDDNHQHLATFSTNKQQQQQTQETIVYEEEVYDDDDEEVVEEEIVEYVEEEILESTFHTVALPGISEENDEDDDKDDYDDTETNNDDDDEYDEVEIHMNGSQSVYSGTEVEVIDDEDESTSFVEEVVDDDYDDNDEHDHIEVVLDNNHMHRTSYERSDVLTPRRVSADDTLFAAEHVEKSSFRKNRSVRTNRPSSSSSSYRLQNPEDDRNSNDNENDDYDNRANASSPDTDDNNNVDGNDTDDNDGASAEELTEAIEYVLRQERAVSKFILTEEQASKMAHLPIPVMKIIVDHLEICDNEQQPIDWDFLLKIVCPYCDE